ncbi:hypothetical protein HPB49_003239 [Dermacentor silvarum]|uniref:Uncharacterized protein n=1 Tax=Dermacentor silvarum TaxID=543639 RepID=A0ACB8DT61_DERSI|nr:hypothetical protein HPB49_003239 [Dermacentor silvarum]
MVYSIEGDDIDPAELNDGTWQHPRGSSDPLDLQKRFGRKKADPPKNAEGANSEGATTPTKRKARPPRLPRRRPMPRLPEDDYKIVLRPKCAVDLANIGLVTLLDAIHSTSKIDVEQAEQADQVRVHPIKNTITISTPDRQRADAYRTITELRNEKYNIDMPVAAYVPAPDDSIRGVVYRAYTDETDETIQSELVSRNPQLPIVNARRLGNSKNFVITFAGKDLPTLIRCRRCGEEHPPPPEGEKPTCTPSCVVCLGKHPTGSRSCKYRFIRPKPTNNGRVSNSNSQAQNSTTTRSSRSRQRTQETLRDRSESFPPLQGRSQSRGRSSSRPSGAQHSGPSTQVTWNGNKPGHQAKTTQPPNPQVRELAEQVKSLQQALAKANNKIRLLESKPNPKDPLTQNAKEIVATVRRDNEQSNNMEVDNGRAAKRKAESQAVTSEKNAAVPEDRLARIEAAIEKLAQEQARAAEEQTKRLKEIEEMTHHHSILILRIMKQIGMPEADGVPDTALDASLAAASAEFVSPISLGVSERVPTGQRPMDHSWAITCRPSRMGARTHRTVPLFRLRQSITAGSDPLAHMMARTPPGNAAVVTSQAAGHAALSYLTA